MDTIAQRRADLEARFERWTPTTLDGWLSSCARSYPDRTFVITDQETLTYAEVEARAQQLASALAYLGVRPGDHVGILMANYADFVPIKFAVARAGAVAIPFNYLYRRDELAYVLAQSDCTFLVTMDSFAGLDYVEMLGDIVPGWDTRPDGEPAGGEILPRLRHIVVRSADARRWPGPLSLAGLAELGAEHPEALGPRDHEPDDLSDLMYTSGSTGSPKGVLVTHDAILRTGYASALTRAYENGRRILFSLPCYHMFGYIEGLLAAMYVGGAVVMQTTFDPKAYFAAIERHRVSDVLCVPTMAIAMIEDPDRTSYDLSSLTAIFCASAPAPAWVWARLRQDFGVSELVTGYGMTETGGCMTLTLPEDDPDLLTTTVGRPKMAGAAGESGQLCQYRSLDPTTGRPVPDGVAGELASRGPTSMRGYYHKPSETEATLRDGWVHSGDLGLVDPRGYLVLTGRSKEVYKSGGELVMPKEVEEVLTRRDDVSQAFAIGVQDERWGEVGWVVVVLAPGMSPTPEELIAHCKQNLARFKVPRRIIFVEAEQLPKTATGKVQKFRLYDAVLPLLADGAATPPEPSTDPVVAQ